MCQMLGFMEVLLLLSSFKKIKSPVCLGDTPWEGATSAPRGLRLSRSDTPRPGEDALQQDGWQDLFIGEQSVGPQASDTPQPCELLL